MPRDQLTETFPAEYVRARLQEIKETHQLTGQSLAEIAGYERVALGRILKNGVPNIFALYRLSEHFGVPMSFWFPPQVTSASMAVPLPLDVVPQGEAPLTKQIVKAVSQLSAEKKHQVRKLVGSDSYQLDQLLDLASVLESVNPKKHSRLLVLLRRLATMVNDEPVPP